jgi:hypothetical protein
MSFSPRLIDTSATLEIPLVDVEGSGHVLAQNLGFQRIAVQVRAGRIIVKEAEFNGPWQRGV